MLVPQTRQHVGLPGKFLHVSVSGNSCEAGWCALGSGGQGPVLTSALTAPVGLVSFCSARFVVQAALWSSGVEARDTPPHPRRWLCRTAPPASAAQPRSVRNLTFRSCRYFDTQSIPEVPKMKADLQDSWL